MVGQVKGDVDDRRVRVDQHVLGDLNLLLSQVSHEIHARFLLEDFREVVGAHVGVLADLFQGNVVGGVAVDVVEDVLDGALPVRVGLHVIEDLADDFHDFDPQVVAVLELAGEMLVAAGALQRRDDFVAAVVVGDGLQFFHQGLDFFLNRDQVEAVVVVEQVQIGLHRLAALGVFLVHHRVDDFAHLFVDVAAGVGLQPFDRLIDRGDELFRPDRLEQQVVDLGLDRLVGEVEFVEGGDQDDLFFRVGLFDPAQHFDAVDFRDVDVHQDDLGVGFLDALQGVLARRGGADDFHVGRLTVDDHLQGSSF